MREKEQCTRVFFVRHGETDFPIDRIYCDGSEDPPLNAVGKRQAEQAAEFLKQQDIAAIYSSPCLRTKMTSQAITANHSGLDVSLEESLVERHFGIWEGLYFDEIEREFPEKYIEWKQNQAAFKPEGGESIFDVTDRLTPLLDGIVKHFRGNSVVIVSHVGPIRVMVAQALGMPVESYRQITIDPASLTCLDYGVSQNNLILLNFHARHWGRCGNKQKLKGVWDSGRYT